MKAEAERSGLVLTGAEWGGLDWTGLGQGEMGYIGTSWELLRWHGTGRGGLGKDRAAAGYGGLGLFLTRARTLRAGIAVPHPRN